MATGRIRVAAADRSRAAARQQEGFNRSLERAGSTQQRTDNRALDQVQRNAAAAGAFQLQDMQRNLEFQDRQNAQFMRSRLDSFNEAQQFQNEQFLQGEQFRIRQDNQTTEANSRFRSAVQAYNQDVNNKNLQSVQEISQTAGKFIQDFEKKRAERLETEGYAAEMMRGFGVTEEEITTFKTAEGVLTDAAIADGQANSLLAMVNLPQAEDQRVHSPIQKGYFGLGQAKARVQKAAARSQVFLQTFMQSEEAVIPDPRNPDRLISPAELGKLGPGGIEAAMRVGVTMMVQEFGLTDINPIIIAEYLSPQLNAVSAQLTSNILASNRRDALSELEWEATQKLPLILQAVPEGDYMGITNGMNQIVADLQRSGKGRKEANDIVVRQAIDYALANNDADLLGALSMADISAEHPDRGTWETHYGDLFRSAVEELGRREDNLRNEQNQAMDALVPRISLQLQDRLIAAGTPEETRAARDWARQALRTLADQGSDTAINELRRLNETPDTENQFYGQKLAEYYKANPSQIPHEVVLKEMVNDGKLNGEQARLIEEYRLKDTVTPRLKNLEGDVKAAARVAITERFQKSGFNSMAELAGLGEGSLSLLSERVMLELQAKVQADPDATNAELMDFAEKRAQAIAAQEGAFNFRKNKDTGRPERLGSLSDGSVRVPGANPLSENPIDRSTALPGNLSRGDVSSNVVMNGEELDALIGQVGRGQSIGGRAAAIGAATGMSPVEVVESQQRLRTGNPDLRLPDPEYDRAAAVAPREATLMRNPNTPQRRRSLTMERLQQMQGLQGLRSSASAARSSLWTTGAALGPGVGGLDASGDSASRGGGDRVQALAPIISLMEFESGNSYTAYNTGRPQAASANPLNIDLTKMTVGEVRQRQGRGELHATGRYQIIGKTLTSVMAEAGVTDKDLYDKNTQDKLGAALMMRRPKLGAYLRGASNDINGAMDDFAKEWAAGVTSSGRPFYNHGGTIPIGRQMAAIRQARTNLQSAEARSLASGGSVGQGGEISLGRIVPPGLDVHHSTGPHLDIAVVRDPDGKREFINPLQALPLLEGLHADGKPIVRGGKLAFPITSGYGPRNIGGGASTYHRAIDLGIPAGAKITWRGAGKLVARSDSLWVDLPNGKSIRILHTIDRRTSKPYQG